MTGKLLLPSKPTPPEPSRGWAKVYQQSMRRWWDRVRVGDLVIVSTRDREEPVRFEELGVVIGVESYQERIGPIPHMRPWRFEVFWFERNGITIRSHKGIITVDDYEQWKKDKAAESRRSSKSKTLFKPRR